MNRFIKPLLHHPWGRFAFSSILLFCSTSWRSYILIMNCVNVRTCGALQTSWSAVVSHRRVGCSLMSEREISSSGMLMQFLLSVNSSDSLVQVAWWTLHMLLSNSSQFARDLQVTDRWSTGQILHEPFAGFSVNIWRRDYSQTDRQTRWAMRSWGFWK